MKTLKDLRGNKFSIWRFYATFEVKQIFAERTKGCSWEVHEITSVKDWSDLLEIKDSLDY